MIQLMKLRIYIHAWWIIFKKFEIEFEHWTWMQFFFRPIKALFLFITGGQKFQTPHNTEYTHSIDQVEQLKVLTSVQHSSNLSQILLKHFILLLHRKYSWTEKLYRLLVEYLNSKIFAWSRREFLGETGICWLYFLFFGQKVT